MSDRSVRVVLSALTAQYQAAMAKAKATMTDFGASATKAGTKMTSVGKTLDKTGSAMMRTGSTLTRRVSFPLLAIGAASVKASLDYDRAFTKISANTNLSGKQIEALKKQVLSLADETAEAPQDLAEGLYFLASAGLDADQVSQTLEQSAKAAASGFGSVGDIARLTANALNAYEKDGLTASEVTDTLAAAIREGTAEPEEFASALGRILPIAQKAGVGFDEVTASLASLSNIGLDVNEGVTAMRGVLTAIEAPGKQAKDTLEDIGLSADDLRAVLADQGVLAALDLLEDRTGGNIDTLHKIIPNVRALSGLFGITGQNAEKVNGSFQRVKNSTGDLDNAFKKTKNSDAWKWKHFITQMKTVAIQIGDDIMPVVLELADVIGDLVDDFMELSPEMRKNILKWGALAIAAGPVLTIFGGLARTIGTIVKLGGGAVRVLGRIGGKAPTTPGVPGGGMGPLGTAARVAGPYVAVAAAAQGAITMWEKASDAANTATARHIESVGASQDLLITYFRNVRNGNHTIEEFAALVQALATEEGLTMDEQLQLIESGQKLIAQYEGMTRTVQGVIYTVDQLSESLRNVPDDVQSTVTIKTVRTQTLETGSGKLPAGVGVTTPSGGGGGNDNDDPVQSGKPTPYMSFGGGGSSQVVNIDLRGSTWSPAQIRKAVYEGIDAANRKSGRIDKTRGQRVA